LTTREATAGEPSNKRALPLGSLRFWLRIERSTEGCSMNSGNQKILLLNDDEAALMARKLLLESHGYEVLTATHPQKALEIIGSQRIDLIVADHFLWYTEGAKIASEIKELNPSLRIILFSGIVQQPEDMQGVDGVVVQIEGPDGLLSVVSSFLSARKAA
jgi:CheY-like chemotaxis protein